MLRRVILFAVVASLLLCATASAAPIQLANSNGLTVGPAVQVTSRLLDVQLGSANVARRATAVGNGVRVLLPADYGTSGKRYPVLYLLHNAGGRSYRAWSDSGPIDRLVGNADVIVVMPDGGVNGWYTDWVDQTVTQKWETYHLTQLVPWVDTNFRTIASRSGRAIAGFGMGGYGALHYAEDRPDLFGAAASFSGAVDIQDPIVAGASTTRGVLYGLNPFGPFGLPGLNAAFANSNAFRHLDRLRGTATFLTVGGGGAPAGILDQLSEAVVRADTTRANSALNALGLPHSFINYGAPGAFPYGYCNGSHTDGCALYALSLTLPNILASLAPAQSPVVVVTPPPTTDPAPTTGSGAGTGSSSDTSGTPSTSGDNGSTSGQPSGGDSGSATGSGGSAGSGGSTSTGSGAGGDGSGATDTGSTGSGSTGGTGSTGSGTTDPGATGTGSSTTGGTDGGSTSSGGTTTPPPTGHGGHGITATN